MPKRGGHATRQKSAAQSIAAILAKHSRQQDVVHNVHEAQVEDRVDDQQAADDGHDHCRRHRARVTDHCRKLVLRRQSALACYANAVPWCTTSDIVLRNLD